jgi:hypothetical protein
MQPDFVWIKSRSNSQGNDLFDSIRGAGYALFSNATNAETNNTANFTSFNSNGFSLASNGGDTNFSGYTYVAWQWRASNATAVTNTAGTISAQVSANTTAGFSIVTYTGNSTVGATIGHGLGVAPQLIIIKSRSNAYNWVVGSKAIDGFSTGKQLYLNTDSSVASGETFFANTQPTSSVFSVKDNYEVNFSGYTYVAYCFAPVAGYSAFGSYAGNGSTDGAFVFTGFRPRFVLLKISSGNTGNWLIIDSARNTYNVVNLGLNPDASDAEFTSTVMDFTSNGFKLRSSAVSFNGSGCNYIYMAFAENPFKYSLAR